MSRFLQVAGEKDFLLGPSAGNLPSAHPGCAATWQWDRMRLFDKGDKVKMKTPTTISFDSFGCTPLLPSPPPPHTQPLKASSAKAGARQRERKVTLTLSLLPC
ncbi:hypothetical protein C0Q70_07121 [Pomacea canaliculata]|uniref:Uncharacterized protein n=1 Tax=Pomacea canaliculata TaxID=400727 RepID=A0A2T7PE51_POMCA|nr:hypothetical protein C0Q70_07121 [Pomacea canaliculata]